MVPSIAYESAAGTSLTRSNTQSRQEFLLAAFALPLSRFMARYHNKCTVTPIKDTPAALDIKPSSEPRAPLYLAAVTATMLVGYSIAILLNTNNRAGDFYWSVMLGRAELATHAPVRHAIFTYALSSQHPVVSMEWLYDGLLAGALKIVPLVVIIFLGYAAMLLSTWWYLRALQITRLRMAVALTALAWFYAPYAAQGRALTCSLILFPILLAVLHLSRSKPRVLLFLPPLFALWINLHGSALLGLGLLGLTALLSWLPLKNSWPRLPLLLTFTLSLGATFITPWGPGLDLYDLRLSDNHVIRVVMSEWQPANLTAIPVLAVLAGVLAILLRARRHRVPLLYIVPVAALLLGWLDAVRVLPYLVVAALGLLLADPAPIVTRHWARLLSGAAAAGVTIALLSSASVGRFAYDSAYVPMPVKDISYLPAHHITGRVLAYYDWEGYLMTQGYQSFVDGRFDIFPYRVTYEEATLAAKHPNPLPLLNRYRVDAVLWPADHSLDRVLRADHWKLVAHSANVDLFLRPASSPVPYVSGLIKTPLR